MRVQGRFQFAALFLGLAALGCYPSAAPPGLTQGLWSGTAGDRHFALEFSGSHLGVHAMLHTLRDGRRLTEKSVFEVTFEPPRIEVWLDEKLAFKGRVDLDKGRIDGEISGLATEPQPLELRRVSRESVEGFLARPAPRDGEPLYRWSRPVESDDGWPVASPEEVGLNRARLEETVSAVIAGEAGLLHSLLIARDGRLVLEEYFHGYGRDDLHDVGMCTLGVGSLLTGIAIDQGQIPSLAVPLLEFYPQQRTRAAKGWDGVSLEHLLTMMTGWRDRRRGSTVESKDGAALIADTLSVSPAHAPGARWRYEPRIANLLTGVLESATGTPVDEFAAAYLFGPLGVDNVEWNGGAKDQFIRMHDGLRLRPRDLAKLGQLVLDEGRWQGRQLVSTEWIRESTTHQLDLLIAGDEQFGYLWWMPPLPTSAEDRVIAARGAGSQFLYVMPSLNTVALVTGGNHFNGKTFLPSHVLAGGFLAAYEP